MAHNKKIIHGIAEVGRVEGEDSQTDFGKTTTAGVAMSVSNGEIRVESGQSDFAEDVIYHSHGLTLGFTLISADLKTLQKAMGLPDDALTGDLEGTTPSNEVLTISVNSLASRGHEKFYVKGGGAGVGVRLYEVMSGKIRLNGDLSIARDQTVEVACIVECLPDETGAVLKVTDAAA